jgi:myo-inositol 2-dehydrogenase / D-chiro-inositol 1-dehydrogenase
VITLRYAGGAIGMIDNSRKAVYGYDQRAEVLGSAGAIESQHKTAYNTVHSTVNGLVAANPLYFFLERYMDSYTAELRAFMAAIQNNTPTAVSGRDGRIPVVIGLAAWQSVREHRPVRISEINEL